MQKLILTVRVICACFLRLVTTHLHPSNCPYCSTVCKQYFSAKNFCCPPHRLVSSPRHLTLVVVVFFVQFQHCQSASSLLQHV